MAIRKFWAGAAWQEVDSPNEYAWWGSEWVELTEGAPSAGIDTVFSAANAMTTVNAPVIALTGYTPVAGDLVVSFPYSTSSATISTILSGWTNPLGGTALCTPADGTVALASVYHFITSGEETAGTNSWTLTDFWNTPETGEILSVVIRGANATAPIDAVGTQFDAGVATTHNLAGLLGADVGTGSLVISALAPDAFGTYATDPSGWVTVQASTGTNQGGKLFERTALTTSGVAVPETAVTPSGSDEYASITLAIAPA